MEQAGTVRSTAWVRLWGWVMGKAKGKSGKSATATKASPFAMAKALAGGALVEHLAANADELGLGLADRTRVRQCLAVWRVSHACTVYQTGGFELDRPDMDRACDVKRVVERAVFIRDRLAAPVKRGVRCKVAAPYRIEMDLPKGESLVVHMALNANAMGLDDDQFGRLSEAYRLWGDDDDRRSVMQRGEDRAAAMGIARAVLDALGGQIGETIALETARSGGAAKVERMSGGRTRLGSRDGLMALYDAGVLTGLSEADRAAGAVRSLDAWTRAKVRMSAALAYREHYEMLAGDLRSNMASLGSAGGGGGAGSDRAANAHAKASRLVSEIDSLVLQSARSPKALLALRAVAGEGQTVRSLTSGGRNAELITKQLIAALDVAAPVLKILGHAVLTGVPK